MSRAHSLSVQYRLVDVVVVVAVAAAVVVLLMLRLFVWRLW